METLDYNQMLLVSLWQYYEKWTGYFNRNLWDMIAYFRSEKENGQKFCDMVARQVGLYQQNRS